jgi:signal transduction histidine kinase
MSSPKDIILARGGETGSLMRQVDWSATAVGPLDSWPQSLRTALGIVMDSRFPMYIAWGPDFVQFYNDAYRPILGSTKHPAALGLSSSVTFAESWDEYIRPLFQRVMDEGEPTYIEDWHLPLDRNGYLEDCYFTFCYSAIRVESGKVGGVLVTVVETTDRVLGERRLKLLRELAARGAEASSVAAVLRAVEEVVHANPDDIPFAAVYLRDTRGTLALAASTGLEARGAAPATVDSLTLAQMRAGAELWPFVPGPAMILSVATGQDGDAGVLIAGVSSRRALDDEYRAFLELVARHIGAAVGNARAHEQERRRAESLAELDRAKTAFFSNVSHEFRTPLTLLLGPIADALADRNAPLPAEQVERILIARRNAERLHKLVNSLLDFSRIEAGRVQGAFRPSVLGELTADIASSFRSTIERAGIGFDVACDPGPSGEPVFVDHEMWEKIVLNLLSNAFKFTFAGTISVRLIEGTDDAVLLVSDTGTGIPADQLPRIFERFHRVEGAQSRSFEGSGIGLSLVQELVRLHGGTIAIESVEGRGTTVSVTLPRGSAHLPAERIAHDATSAGMSAAARSYADEASNWLSAAVIDDAEPRPAELPPAVNEADRSAVEAGRVLVVDDNADMRAYLSRLLAPLFTVDTAADGAEALKMIRQCRPDVVLSDVMMPVMDGFELMRTIRADEGLKTLSVILISARAGEEATVEGLQAGADEYIVKPFSARELIARVRSRVEVVQTRNEAERRLAEIIRLAPAFIAVTRGPEHVFEMSNPPYDELVGRRPLVGRAVREAFPEVEGQGIFDLLDAVYETGVPFRANEMRIELRDESGVLRAHYLNFVYQALRAADGSVSGMMAHGVDITPQVDARLELERLYKAVTDANRAKSDFLSMMSHELRTPLNAIIGFTELMELEVHGPVSADQANDLTRITRAGKYLLGLINDILNFSKLEAAQVEFRPARFDLDATVADAAALMAPLFAERQLAFSWVPCGSGWAMADPDRVKQILLNLLSNAIKFTPRGGAVSVAVTPGAQTVRLEVRDTGTGIPAAQLGRIFEPFVQVHNSATVAGGQGGVGLGLAISRELARAMGGDLTATSEASKGSVFTLELPAA